MAIGGSSSIPILIAVAIVGLFGVITFALTAATLGTLNKRYDNLREQIVNLENKISTTTLTPATAGPSNNSTAATAGPANNSTTATTTTQTIPDITTNGLNNTNDTSASP